MRAVFVKTLGALRPADPDADAFMRATKEGRYIIVDAKRPRNVQHHRKLFAMLNIIFENQSFYQSVDQLLAACKIAVGHVDLIRVGDNVYQIPKSIAFGSMSQDEFDPFYEKAVTWMLEKVIPGLARHDLDAEVEQSLRKFAA